jgi:hypothetical protein
LQISSGSDRLQSRNGTGLGFNFFGIRLLWCLAKHRAGFSFAGRWFWFGFNFTFTGRFFSGSRLQSPLAFRGGRGRFGKSGKKVLYNGKQATLLLGQLFDYKFGQSFRILRV